MRKSFIYLPFLLIVLIIFSFHGCAGGRWGELEIVEDTTDGGVRQKWNEYTQQ